jgi:hypothetical protein
MTDQQKRNGKIMDEFFYRQTGVRRINRAIATFPGIKLKGAVTFELIYDSCEWHKENQSLDYFYNGQYWTDLPKEFFLITRKVGIGNKRTTQNYLKKLESAGVLVRDKIHQNKGIRHYFYRINQSGVDAAIQAYKAKYNLPVYFPETDEELKELYESEESIN